MAFATAVRRIGRGTGAGAVRHRRAARDAMAKCYDAVPCWIMPSWRVSEQLPAELGAFDLVIMDEASQSDIKEVTALLRGKKVLIVGDDKQVSPSAAFIENNKLDRLERAFLQDQPFKTLLLPGSSLYDLAKVMFPDKFVMLREHFRCVEPIIRFSMQFYPEPLIPLRIAAAAERLDPPLIDIFVPDGRRTGDKVNQREADVIVEEIKKVISTPDLARIAGTDRCRTIGVVSLIGAKQAALINRMLIDAIGEEAIVRHKIACGDSATFQGNERDIVFLSMTTGPGKRSSQTATAFEQRFNVALSRARDRMVLVRSVKEEQLNPADLKARVIRHFHEPMAGASADTGNLLDQCDSQFERDVAQRLLDKGYRVRPQVGSLGFRIDLVVEGDKDRRLAIELDGDKYHGPERWADDMRRQRILERVGWRFWRCWASSFALDAESCMADLFDTLNRAGIQPGNDMVGVNVYTEHRVVSAAPFAPVAIPVDDVDTGIDIGDRVTVRYLDTNKPETFTITADQNDLTNGLISAASPLGSKLLGLQADEELEFETSSGARRVLVVAIQPQYSELRRKEVA
jgi:very-short-patch-repair endonuclease